MKAVKEAMRFKGEDASDFVLEFLDSAYRHGIMGWDPVAMEKYEKICARIRKHVKVDGWR